MKTKKQQKNTKKTTKGLLAYHIAASLVSTAPHPHTGRSIHHRHTSHGILLLALLLTGVLLFSNIGVLRAYGLTGSGSITVNVAGVSPIVGADITYPATNTTTKSSQIQVRGTCEASTLVATYNNGVFAGSSMCTEDSNYATTIQLQVGLNILQSQDYDGLNQPGPVTAQVMITRVQDPVPVATIATTPSDVTPNPAPADVTPAPQPAENPCYDTSKIDTLDPASPTIIANCINRGISAGEKLTLPIRISGGTAPFALSINWGDGLTELKSVADTDYHNYEHVYQTTGIINVALKTTDSKGATSFLQTVVQVNNTPSVTSPTGPTSPFATITAGLGSVWTEAPVPLYWAAVTLVLGFWVGDIFQRVFARGKYSNKKVPKTFNHHRHA